MSGAFLKPHTSSLHLFLVLVASLAGAVEFTPPAETQAHGALKAMVITELQPEVSGLKPPASGLRKAWLDVLGTAQWTELVKADDKQISVRLQGNILDVRWAKLSREQVLSVGTACIQDKGQNALTVADYCLATGELRKGDELLKKALELSPALAAETSARWEWLKKQSGVAAAAKGPKAGDAAAGNAAVPVKAGKLDRAGIVREITDFSLAGMNRRLGPDYAHYHPHAKDEKFPELWMPPVKEGAKGRRYEIGGPWTKEAGDFSSTQGQILYVPDSGVGVDRVTILEMSNSCFSERPEPPWWGGFRPEPAAKHWQQAAGGNPGVPVCMARGMGNWSNCGVIVFSSGLVGTAGTCTGKGSDPTFQFPRNKVPTAISVTNKNEFALVTICDVEQMKGQVAVLALESSAKKTGFAHEWHEDHPCLPNVAVLTRIKLLGYVDLPGIAAPTGICAVGNHASGRLSAPSGHAGMLSQYDLAQQSHRDAFLKGNNAQYSSDAGFAVVIARYEDKAAFLDLQALFQRVREMYFTTEENYKKTRDAGNGPKQWPYTFEDDPSWKPQVVTVVDQPQPTAVIASMGGGKKARAFIASLDGRIGVYQVGGLATDEPAQAADIKCASVVQAGRNPVCLAYQKHSHDTIIAVSRGDREIEWIKYSEKDAQVIRRLRDARLLDPVHVEAADTHGIETSLVTVADFRGRKIVNYRCGELVFATQGGAKFGMGPDGKDEFECGGLLELPGSPFCISASNVN